MIRHRCAECSKLFYECEVIFVCHKYGIRYLCLQCSERKHMPNIKITAEIDGKIVPLNTISTESFEAIKALEKPKEIPIPVARLANNRSGAPRLLFRPASYIILDTGRLYALDLKLGVCSNQWLPMNDGLEIVTYYKNVQPL